MHTVKLSLENDIYQYVMWYLRSIKSKSLIIEEDIDNTIQINQKQMIQNILNNSKEALFEDIKDPLQWQIEQRDEW